MREIYTGYIEIATQADCPFIMCAPTWRASYKHVKESGINPEINIDAVRFMQEIRNMYAGYSHKIKIGGIVGCKNDCYKPEEGLSVKDSEKFHSWQIDQLVHGDADFLIAETLPNIDEAIGIAKAMGKTGVPYIISFVISREGRLLDNTELVRAIHRIDQEVVQTPLGYAVNCAYPSFLNATNQPPEVFSRLIGYLANASSLDHCDLDECDTLQSNDISEWGNEMLKLHRTYGVKILGGCCGTNEEHLSYLTEH